ncbi:DUF3135 domain-containing protein [Pseudomaricurvus alkylphenolicus]|jgi:hypothetical protein|uniref:DUF3135 domain-containing protein n=1 Tax=Pseudomaricurvus alkylphenolicus TaxID=1306991 RepID=UPI0014204CAA|nr:DUF3135 domain-containing protein [Pseudomaricurvus alkylphenolicus]NIB43012.1 DUF3135 domain-containing protein [Pseudomaricurvus alkylphenolicus]
MTSKLDKKFDDLMELAQQDPEALERYRQQKIQSLIENSPEYVRRRLLGLQFQIDAHRQLHNNPMGSCIKLTQMMHDSFDQMRELLNKLSGDRQRLQPPQKQKNSAKILPFPTPENP